MRQSRVIRILERQPSPLTKKLQEQQRSLKQHMNTYNAVASHTLIGKAAKPAYNTVAGTTTLIEAAQSSYQAVAGTTKIGSVAATTYKTVAGETGFIESAQLGYKEVAGTTQIGSVAATTYKTVAGETGFIESAQLGYQAVSGNTNIGQAALPAYENIAGTTTFIDAARSGYQAVAGHFDIGGTAIQTYKTVAGKTTIKQAAHNAYEAVSGNIDIGKAATPAYNAVAGTTTFIKAAQSSYQAVAGTAEIGSVAATTYKTVAGETGFIESAQLTYEAVAGDTDIGKAALPTYKKVAGTTTFINAAKSGYQAVAGDIDIGDAATRAYSTVAGTQTLMDSGKQGYRIIADESEVGGLFTKINRSNVFGSQPWLKQTVISRSFHRTAEYQFSEGPIGRAKKDFLAARKYTDIVFTGSSGFFTGLFASIALTAPYMTYGVLQGAKNNGAYGVVKGLLHSVWKAISLPFRNAHRNLQALEGKTNVPDNSSLINLIHRDAEQLSRSEFIGWEIFEENGIPNEIQDDHSIQAGDGENNIGAEPASGVAQDITPEISTINGHRNAVTAPHLAAVTNDNEAPPPYQDPIENRDDSSSQPHGHNSIGDPPPYEAQQQSHNDRQATLPGVAANRSSLFSGSSHTGDTGDTPFLQSNSRP